MMHSICSWNSEFPTSVLENSIKTPPEIRLPSRKLWAALIFNMAAPGINKSSFGGNVSILQDICKTSPPCSFTNFKLKVKEVFAYGT